MRSCDASHNWSLSHACTQHEIRKFVYRLVPPESFRPIWLRHLTTRNTLLTGEISTPWKSWEHSCWIFFCMRAPEHRETILKQTVEVETFFRGFRWTESALQASLGIYCSRHARLLFHDSLWSTSHLRWPLWISSQGQHSISRWRRWIWSSPLPCWLHSATSFPPGEE